MPVTLDNLKDQVKIKTMPINICVFPQNTMTIGTLRQTQTNDYSNPRKKKQDSHTSLSLFKPALLKAKSLEKTILFDLG